MLYQFFFWLSSFIIRFIILVFLLSLGLRPITSSVHFTGPVQPIEGQGFSPNQVRTSGPVTCFPSIWFDTSTRPTTPPNCKPNFPLCLSQVLDAWPPMHDQHTQALTHAASFYFFLSFCMFLSFPFAFAWPHQPAHLQSLQPATRSLFLRTVTSPAPSNSSSSSQP